MQLLQNGKQQFIDQNGAPLAGGSVALYAPGTTNPVTTYMDQAGTTANPNPVPLDSRGQAVIWANGAVRQIVMDASGVTVWDQIASAPDVSSAASALSTALAAKTGASLIGFIASGVGAALRLIQDKLRDRVSVKDFGATGDGVTDDTAAFQAAMNYAGTARTIFLPVGTYIVSASLILASGMKFEGEGDQTGAAGAAIKVNPANYSNINFQMFVKPSGLFQSAIFENIRFLGGGNHFYFDLSTGSAYKVKWDNCVFQDAVGNHIFAVNSANGSGLLVCRHRGCSVINSGGISSSGPINATEISGGSWENMKGPALYVADTGNYPNLKFTFTKNRIEGLYTGINKGDYPVVQLDGHTYGADLSDNYHENTFSKLLKLTNSRGVIFARNTHTDSALTLATMDITDSQVSIFDNYSLVGGTVNFSGTKCSVPRWSANQGFSIAGLYGKTGAATVDDPVLLGSGGISYAAFPGLYKGETGKLKIVPVPINTGTYTNLFTITAGSSASLGSRVAAMLKVSILLDVIDSTAGANLICAQEFLIAVWSNAGGTMASAITSLGATVSPAGTSFTLRQQAGASAASLTLECAITNANLAYNTASKMVVKYEYLADENNSQGMTIA